MKNAGKRAKLEAEKKEAVAKARVILGAAEKENREITAEERAKLDAHLNEAETLNAQVEQIDGEEALRRKMDALAPKDTPAAQPGDENTNRPRSVGHAFIGSEIFAQIKAGRHRQPGFNAAQEFEDFVIGATTLDESAGSGGKLVLPDYQSGVLPLLFRQIKVTDLIAPGTTNSNSVEYMRETTFTNNAAVRAEGAAAAESVLVFDRVNEPVRSIDNSLPVTQEMAEDGDQILSYINGRLILGVELARESEILSGDGTGVHLTGILNRANLAAAQARGADSNFDAIFKQITAIMVSAFVMPDGVVLNPTNWMTMVLAKDGNANYLGGGPFQAAQAPVVWGLPAAVTSVMTLNTGLVGAFRSCAQHFVRRGVTVQASNSHSDYFTKRLISVLAGMRQALAVYRPGAFGTVTGLN